MNLQFIDTYYLLALVNTTNKGHEAALRHSQGVTSGAGDNDLHKFVQKETAQKARQR